MSTTEPENDARRITMLSWSAMGQKRQGRFVLGIIVFVAAVGYTWEAFRIPFGTLAQPGAGLFPRVVGFVAAFIALILVAESLFSRSPAEDIDLPRGKQLKLVLWFFGGTLAFILLLPILGQYIAGILYVVGMIKVLGDKVPWWKAIVYGVVISVTIAWIFINLLKVSLPPGIILPS